MIMEFRWISYAHQLRVDMASGSQEEAGGRGGEVISSAGAAWKGGGAPPDSLVL